MLLYPHTKLHPIIYREIEGDTLLRCQFFLFSVANWIIFCLWRKALLYIQFCWSNPMCINLYRC